MNVASDIKSRQELDELKTVMEIFVVKNRVRELAKLA